MPRQKGTPKTGGRVAGTPNKKKSFLREKIAQFTEDNFDLVIQDWRLIPDAKDRVKAYIDLCAYAIPKLQAVQMDANVSHSTDVEDDLKRLAED